MVICENEELLLKPGMTVTATVVIDERKGVVAVSNLAFMINPDGSEADGAAKFLWKKNGGLVGQEYIKTDVKIGLIGDMYTEIIEGVREDEEVMTKIMESK